MLSIAYTPMRPEDLSRFESALPHAQFIYIPSLAHAEQLAEQGMIAAVVITDKALRQRGYARLSVLKSAHPDILVLAYLEPPSDVMQSALALGRAQCDGVVLRGIDDSREQLRETFALAALRSVTDAVYGASSPAPSLLTPVSLERVLRAIDRINGVGDLARALGVSRRALRVELRRAGMFEPRRLSAWLRLLMAARLLGDTDETAEQVGLSVGYSSGPAFHGACRRLVGATPREIRKRGGLRFAVARYRADLASWRSATT